MDEWVPMFRIMLLQLLDLEDDSSMILRNAANYSPNDRTSFPRKVVLHVVVIL